MDIKSQIYNFSMNNIFNIKTESNENELEISEFVNKVERELEEHKHNYDIILIINIRSKLTELCKLVKRRTQKEEEEASKNDKNKPLVHIHQEARLRDIVYGFAIKDNNRLLDFLKLIQCMLRGMLYE